ncbi:hypothetical protein GGF42_004087 [Coemansia sp. RSA 2424]|nr:hypothetical protein GGF42_004087 [Coemansia sp. RSA 2424]
MHAVTNDASAAANSSPFVLQTDEKPAERPTCTACGGFIEEGGMDEHVCLIFRFEM